jgi:hypothetical protein
VVVDLAVLHDLDPAVLVANRLIAAFEVDDRQAAGGERRGPFGERPRAVGTAMDERVVHRRRDRRVDGLTLERDDPADAAHEN